MLLKTARPTIRGVFRRLPARLNAWQGRVREPALTALLLSQLTFLFVVNPLLTMHRLPLAVLDGMHLLLLSISYFVLPPGSWVRLLLGLCVLPLLVLWWTGINHVSGLVLSMLATLSITLAVAKAVFQARRVALHQLLGAVVVYLNIPLLFMGAFIVIDRLAANAFASASGPAIQPGDMLYFSLTTVTSTGYGDILPVHPLAQSLANLESVIGQLYLTILLGRLVSLHLGQVAEPPGQQPQNPLPDSGQLPGGPAD